MSDKQMVQRTFAASSLRQQENCVACFESSAGVYADNGAAGRIYLKAPALANTPASASQQAAQLSPRAAPPAEYHGRKINIGS